jgi:hypothetical protein
MCQRDPEPLVRITRAPQVTPRSPGALMIVIVVDGGVAVSVRSGAVAIILSCALPGSAAHVASARLPAVEIRGLSGRAMRRSTGCLFDNDVCEALLSKPGVNSRRRKPFRMRQHFILAYIWRRLEALPLVTRPSGGITRNFQCFTETNTMRPMPGPAPVPDRAADVRRSRSS